MNVNRRRCLEAMLFAGASSLPLCAADWTRFRGENGTGVASDASLPTTWSEKENLAWKEKMPGPGSSSPIVIGNKIFVTCWSGYGTPEAGEGKLSDLKRHLVCVDRKTGKTIWDKSIPASLPEDEYGGMFAQHGYASHTPVSDGQRVYVFFGKSGVFAFDMDGNQKWHARVGDGLDERRWGSACSPLLYKGKVIVLASAESRTMFAFDCETGKEVWKTPADNFASTWGTPVLVQLDDQKTELVVGVPGEIWGFDPDTGKFKWYCPCNEDDSYCSSVVADKNIVYAVEGRSGGGIAVRAGGKDDVSKTHVVWKNGERNRIGTPVVIDSKIYFFRDGIANCLDASTGKQLYQARMPSGSGAASSSAPPAEPNRGGPGGRGGERGGPGGRGGRGGRGGGGGGMGGQDYSSAVAGDGKIFFVSRGGNMHVLKVSPTFEHLAVNRVTDQAEDFSSTPAIAGNQIFVRSSHYLYCIGSK